MFQETSFHMDNAIPIDIPIEEIAQTEDSLKDDSTRYSNSPAV